MSIIQEVSDPIGDILGAWLKVEQARLDRKLIESRIQAESYMQPSYLSQPQAQQQADGGLGGWARSNPVIALAALAALGGLVYLAVK